jgi:Domain of unknown function (DUF3291)
MNYAKLKASLDDPIMSELRNAFQPINDIAKTIPGFIWSLDYEEDDRDHYNDTILKMREQVPLLRDDPNIMPQLSLWKDLVSIQHFAYKTGHFMYWKRRKEWFIPIPDEDNNNSNNPRRYAVCWWWKNEHWNDENALDIINHDNNMTTKLVSYPTLKDSFDRCDYLRDYGPSYYAFDFNSAKDYPMPMT